METERLYRKFSEQTKRIRFTCLLGVLCLDSVVRMLLLAFNTEDNLPRTEMVYGAATASTSFLSLLILCTCFGKRRPVTLFTAALTWLIQTCGSVVLTIMASLLNQSVLVTLLHIVKIQFVIYSTYTMLPFPRKIAVITTCFSTAALGLSLVAAKEEVEHNLSMIIGTTFALLAMHIAGFGHICLQDRLRRNAFTDARECIEERVRLEHEKEQQEQLLTSVLPLHLAVEMKNRMLQRLSACGSDRRAAGSRFHEMYIKLHQNVSILFADIVNFTPLAAECSAAELVKTLNQLFGKFDALAKDNDCMRIKILGDCYYCVSGLPVSRPKHALNCVTMGLQMIKAIRFVREAYAVSVDMRIGVHSGSVLSGVIGLRKWQYDIWSDDVIIANSMESAGFPGKVHISESCKEELGEVFETEPGFGSERSELLKSRNIKTFLIVSPAQDATDDIHDVEIVKGSNRMSKAISAWGEDKPFQSLLDCSQLPNNIAQTSISSMEISVKSFTLSINPRRWFSFNDLQPCSLAFKDAGMSRSFRQKEDPNFHFAVTFIVILYAIVGVITACLHKSGFHGTLPYVLAMTLFAPIVFLSWLQRIKLQKLSRWKVLSFMHRLATVLFQTASVLLVTSIILLVTMTTLISLPGGGNADCHHLSQDSLEMASNISRVIAQEEIISDCSRELLLLATTLPIALVATSLFIALPYLFTLSMSMMSTVAFLLLLQFPFQTQWEGVSSFLPHVTVNFFSLLIVVFISIRQTEIISKLGFYWKTTFSVEKNDVEVTRSVNKVLLENILPAHIAEHFLTLPHRKSVQDLYHESYDSACVMFASIPNFAEFYVQNSISSYGLECLRVLNEIIGEFDELLSKLKFSSVEKIKTIGSSYMAATGLQPGRNQRRPLENVDLNVVVMVEFALSMASELTKLNEQFLNNFSLRIGLNHGAVVAGVICGKKPTYDIWGDTVNVSARMDSSGREGHIQIPEDTAAVLINKGYNCILRGNVAVKGKKDPIKTYLIKLP